MFHQNPILANQFRTTQTTNFEDVVDKENLRAQIDSLKKENFIFKKSNVELQNQLTRECDARYYDRQEIIKLQKQISQRDADNEWFIAQKDMCEKTHPPKHNLYDSCLVNKIEEMEKNYSPSKVNGNPVNGHEVFETPLRKIHKSMELPASKNRESPLFPDVNHNF